MRILVTGCSGPAGRALGKQLARSVHTVVGADMSPRPDPNFDMTVQVPAAGDSAMIPELRRLLKEQAIDVVIPTVSDELTAIASAARSLLTHASVVIGCSDAVAIAHDKYLTMAQLASESVPVPRFALPCDFTSAQHALDDMGGAFVAKPRVARGGRGVIVVEQPGDIDWDELDDSMIIQEFAPGTEYAPMVYVHSAQNMADTVVTVRKDVLAQGRIGNAASVTRVDNATADGAPELALRAVKAIGLTGPADIDVRLLADGRPVVLEINARFGANSSYAPEILRAVLAEHAPRTISEAV